MKKILTLIVLGIAGYAAWQYFTQPPDPAQQRANAQRSDYQTARYWLGAAKDQRHSDLTAVCDDAARQQAQAALEAIRQREKQTGGRFSTFDCLPMGAPGAFKAVLGSDAGMLLHLTIRAEKKGERYWIVEVTPD